MNKDSVLNISVEEVEDFDARRDEMLGANMAPIPPSQPAPQADASIVVNADQLRLLVPVVKKEGNGHSFTWFAKAARMSPKKAKVIREQLTEGGFIIQDHVNLNQMGRTSILLRPTEKGRQAVRDAQQKKESR